ncbi:glycosyltransferase family 21 protein [Roridomyces roridus]|uniref:Ceramide glucosyltransferase n=1 Tax=Roridomyces roridus TaxID=1738132 RepID=A0AAD7FL74_9AGAR|nr:glycosyltransferase family 21 protein [Roridomyces roridus]
MIRLVLSSVGLIWYSAIWAIGLVGCSAARKRYRNRPRSPLASAAASSVPGVSILRPLKGLDTNLYENLESTFLQEYPNYEIILSVADENDQALPIARELTSKYPHVKCRIIVGEENVGTNPKVNNLVRPYREAANDILWVIDSNVTVHPGTLARSVDALVGSPTAPAKKRIALVHHVPFAVVTESRIGSRIEEAFLNTNHAKMYIAINTLAVDSCVMGKSNLYRRSDLERVIGSLKPPSPNTPQSGPRGLPAFGRFLAEDNMIGAALWHELGDRHELSCDVANNLVGNMTLMDYIRRRARWIRVRKHMVLAATLVEPFTESVVLSIICASSLNYLLDISPWISIFAHFAVWIYVDLDVYASIAGHPLPAAIRWEFAAPWVARELLALPIFLFAVFGSEVTWRGRAYTVLRNGEVARAEKTLSWFQRLRKPKNYDPLDTSL